MFLCLKHGGSSLMIIMTEGTVRVDTGKNFLLPNLLQPVSLLCSNNRKIE